MDHPQYGADLPPSYVHDDFENDLDLIDSETELLYEDDDESEFLYAETSTTLQVRHHWPPHTMHTDWIAGPSVEVSQAVVAIVICCIILAIVAVLAFAYCAFIVVRDTYARQEATRQIHALGLV